MGKGLIQGRALEAMMEISDSIPAKQVTYMLAMQPQWGAAKRLLDFVDSDPEAKVLASKVFSRCVRASYF